MAWGRDNYALKPFRRLEVLSPMKAPRRKQYHSELKPPWFAKDCFVAPHANPLGRVLPNDIGKALGFLDPKHLCPTLGACAAGGRSLVLQGDSLGILDLHLFPALDAVSLCHSFVPPLFGFFCGPRGEVVPGRHRSRII